MGDRVIYSQEELNSILDWSCFLTKIMSLTKMSESTSGYLHGENPDDEARL